MSGHTPGPWCIWQAKDGSGEPFDMPDASGGRAVRSEGGQVASVFHAGADGAANARLIAAAPDMLSVLEKSLGVAEVAATYEKRGLQKALEEIRQMARAAISKAKGETA